MSGLAPLALIEAALLCAAQPLSVSELRAVCGNASADDVSGLLRELATLWAGRAIELRQVAEGWRFQTRPEAHERLERLHPDKPPRYPRAVLETLTIVAHRQPVTRGDIEDIRGVAVASQIMRQLEERGWLRARGHREVPGRPVLWETTPQFLSDFGVASIDELKGLLGGTTGERVMDGVAMSSDARPTGTQIAMDLTTSTAGSPPAAD